MAATINDMFTKVGGEGTITTLEAPGKAIGATTINIGSGTNWPTDTAVYFAIRTTEVVAGETQTKSGTYTVWKGTISGTIISNLAYVGGAADQVYAAGSTTQVYVGIHAEQINELVDGLLVAHDQDGTLKAGAVDVAAVLASNVVTTAKIANSAVTSEKLAPSKTTDANGWTVYDYGTWKEYERSYLNSFASTAIAAFNSYTAFTNVTLPVGSTSLDDYFYQVTGRSSNVNVVITGLYLGTGATFTIRGNNIANVSQNIDAHNISVRLKSK